MSFRVKPKHHPTHPESLRFPIYHGDMVVMHGTEIHRLYEVGIWMCQDRAMV